VLGYLLGVMLVLMLVLTALSSVIITEVFADSFVAEFDKNKYGLGDSVAISGEILEFGMPVIAMSIYDPDGKILSANNLEITPQSTFSKSIPLGSPFYDKTGEYLVTLAYGQITQNHYFVVENGFFEPEIIVEDFEKPEIVVLYTDKNQYTDGDVIQITGLVSALDSPTALIGIYDPFGMPAGFYFGAVDPNLEFSTSFLAKAGVNFRVDGIYSIKAHYAETEAISFFNFYENLQPVIEDEIEDKTNKDTNLEEKIEEPLDEIITDPVIVPTHKEIINEDEKINEKETSNNNSISEILVDNFQKQQSNSDKNSIIQNQKEEISATTKNSEIKEPKIIKQSNPVKTSPKTEIKKQTNLTIEDIELGLLLNQINLECDASTLTDTISYYDGMGPALYRLCKFDSSLNFFNESLINNPNDVEILANKGSALGKLGYFSEAILYYDQAIKIDPNFLPAKNNKANALANLGNFDDAISLYHEILQKNPNYITVQNNLQFTLSMTPQIDRLVDIPEESHTQNIVFEEPTPENTGSLRNEKENHINFFDEIGHAFSSLGSLFDFLN